MRYFPKNYVGADAAAIIVLHGGKLGNAERTVDQTDFEVYADRYGFAVVYPNASEDQWNDGRPETDTGVDDLGYIKAIADDLVTNFGVAEDRVFVTGVSNGGIMSQWLVCNDTYPFAAIAPVVSNMPVQAVDQCKTASPIPVVIFHGTKDASYNGTTPESKESILGKGSAGGTMISAEETVAVWAEVDKCTGRTLEATIDNDPNDGTSVEIYQYNNCAPNGDLRWYKVIGGGHAWFGMELGPLAQRLVGTPGTEISSVEEIVNFFKQYGL